MNDQDIRRTERATRVQSFGVTNAAGSDPDSKAGRLFTRLDAVILRLGAARVGQIRTPVTKEAVLGALFADFKDIARTSRAIGLEEPGFQTADFRFPADYTENSATTHGDYLLKIFEDKTGDSPAQLAAREVLRSKFIAFELPADFVEDLRADRDALDSANRAKHGDNQEGLESTAAISTLLIEAKGIVAQLDSIMHNRFSRDRDKLHAWKKASRVERSPRRSTPPPPAAPAP